MGLNLSKPGLNRTFLGGQSGQSVFFILLFIAYFFASGSAIFHDIRVYLVYLCQELTQTNDSWVDE